MNLMERVNQVEHPVEDQWHYPIMSKAGYIPITKTAKGLVRSYTYTHPITGHSMYVNTGVACDYWTDGSDQGYWGTLESHLWRISKQSDDKLHRMASYTPPAPDEGVFIPGYN